jgi:cell division protein FtsQ
MTDVLTGGDYVTPGRHARRERSLHKVLVAIIVILALALAGELAYHLFVVPRMAVSSITIRNDLGLTDDQLLALSGIDIGTLYFKLDVDEAAERIEQHPAVSAARVERHFPNSVTIDVQGRTPLAVALAETDSGAIPLVFDEEGIVFSVDEPARAAELPVISGLRFSGVEVGMELPSLVVQFLSDLRSLRLSAPDLFALFSEYRIVRLNDYAYEVVIYPMYYQVPVRIGTTINTEMIQYVLIVLEMLRREGRLSLLAEIDFRNGEGVLITREDANG